MLESNNERSFYENLKHHRNVVSFTVKDFNSQCLLSIPCEMERKNLILALKEANYVQEAQKKPVLFLKNLSNKETFLIDNVGALFTEDSAYMFFAQTSLYLPPQVILVENTLNQLLPVAYKDKKEFFIRRKIYFQYVESKNIRNFSDLIIYTSYKAIRLILSNTDSTDFIIYVN